MLFGPTIAFDGDAPEREDYAQVVLTGRLEKAIKSINTIFFIFASCHVNISAEECIRGVV